MKQNLVNCISDPSTWALLIPFVITIYGFILFLWWWQRMGSASEVYAYITFLFAAAAIPLGFGVAARLLSYFIERDSYEHFIHSWVWEIRTIPLVVALLLITLRMTIRVIRTHRYKQKNSVDKS